MIPNLIKTTTYLAKLTILLYNIEMSPDRKPSRLTDKRFLVAAFAAALLLPPASNLDHTAFVLNSIMRGQADCSAGVQSKNPLFPYDAIAVPGTEPNSFDNETRVRGARQALENGLAPEIIWLGLNHRSNVNTPTNMEELSETAREKDFKKVVIVTSAYHRVRSVLLACANDVAATSISAEGLLIENDLNELPSINDRYFSFGMMWTKLKEKLLSALLIWDFKGEIPTNLKRAA